MLPGDITMSEGHGHPLVLYIITNVVCVRVSVLQEVCPSWRPRVSPFTASFLKMPISLVREAVSSCCILLQNFAQGEGRCEKLLEIYYLNERKKENLLQQQRRMTEGKNEFAAATEKKDTKKEKICYNNREERQKGKKCCSNINEQFLMSL